MDETEKRKKRQQEPVLKNLNADNCLTGVGSGFLCEEFFSHPLIRSRHVVPADDEKREKTIPTSLIGNPKNRLLADSRAY